jgi:hypothetical protein
MLFFQQPAAGKGAATPQENGFSEDDLAYRRCFDSRKVNCVRKQGYLWS